MWSFLHCTAQFAVVCSAVAWLCFAYSLSKSSSSTQILTYSFFYMWVSLWRLLCSGLCLPCLMPLIFEQGMHEQSIQDQLLIINKTHSTRSCWPFVISLPEAWNNWQSPNKVFPVLTTIFCRVSSWCFHGEVYEHILHRPSGSEFNSRLGQGFFFFQKQFLEAKS